MQQSKTLALLVAALKLNTLVTGDMDNFIGIDIASGSAGDFTTAAILKPSGDLTLCQRLKPMPFHDQCEQLKTIVDQPGESRVFIDKSGLGIGWHAELKRISDNKDIHGVTITGGKNCSRKGEDYNCPKRVLVNTLRMVINNGWLRIRCEHYLELKREMNNFIQKGNGKLEAGKGNDDLVLAVCLALMSYATYKQEL